MLVQVTKFVVKSGLYSGWSIHSHTNCCNKAAICWAMWGLSTKWLSSFWSSAGPSWWSHIPNCCGNKLPQRVPIHQAQNSVLKITFTNNTWQMCEPSRWLCGKVGHCSLFSWELLFWTKNFWRSKYALHILTFQSTLVIFKQEPLMFQDELSHVRPA